jgi:hypothetical protein
MAFKNYLDKSSRKFFCPGCNQKRLVRYIDAASGNYCGEQFGRCDREVKCGYHLAPEANDKFNDIILPPAKSPYHVSKKLFRQTLSFYEQNNLYCFLREQFGEPKTRFLVSAYKVGTSKHWDGATLFWQINYRGIIGQGKIMLFDKETGKRVKEPFPHITSVHKLLNKQDEKPEFSFFGEHLLQIFPSLPVAMVESEKTALVMAAIEPACLWIASGGLSQLNSRRMNAYKNRKIIFFPDLGAYDKWNQKANDLRQFGHDVYTSSLLEEKATPADRTEGFDLADYFIKKGPASIPGLSRQEIMVKRYPLLQTLIDRFQLIPAT